MNITAHYDEIAHCNHCGFCQTACPIFRSTGYEGGVARGRLALLRAVIEGRLQWGPELEEPLYTCLLCGACTSNCFPAIPTADLVTTARSEYLEKVGRKSIHRLLFDKLLPYPRRLHLAARAVALGKNSGMSELARALGLLRIFGRDLSRAEAMVDRLPAQPFRARFKPGVFDGHARERRPSRRATRRGSRGRRPRWCGARRSGTACWPGAPPTSSASRWRWRILAREVRPGGDALAAAGRALADPRKQARGAAGQRRGRRGLPRRGPGRGIPPQPPGCSS